MAISYVGSASAISDTVSLPSFQVGDLAIVLAARFGTIGAPEVPIGWTSITSNSAGAYSGTLGYRYLQSGDTSIGTWTGATKVAVVVYRGVNSVEPFDATFAFPTYSGVVLVTTATAPSVIGGDGLPFYTSAAFQTGIIITEADSGTNADDVADTSPVWTNRTAGGNDWCGISDTNGYATGNYDLSTATRQIRGWVQLRAASTFAQVSDRDAKEGTVTSNSSSWTLTYPTSLKSGDLILAILAVDGATNLGLNSGWNQWAAYGGSPVMIGVMAKISNGTETGTFSVALTGSEQGAWRVIRIIGWYGSGLATNNISGAATFTEHGNGMSVRMLSASSGSTPDPPELDPSNWATEDTLWIAAMAADTSRTVSAYPSSTEDQRYSASGGSNGATLGFSRRELAASLWDPSTFTISASDDWATATIAIRPAPSSTGQTVAAQLLAQSKSIFNPTVAPGGVSVVAQLIANGQSFYNPVVAQLVLAQLLANARSVNNPTVSPGAVAVVAQLIANGNIVQSPKVLQQVVVPAIANGNQPYAPTIKPTNLITLALLADTISLYNPTVTPGAVTVVVGTLTDTPVLYNPRPQQTISVVMQLIDIAEAAYNPTVVPGGVSVQVPVLNDLVTVGSPQVLQKVLMDLLTDTPALYAPKVLQKVMAQLISDPTALFDPKILQRVQAQLILDTPALHDPKVLQQVAMAALSDTISVPNPSVLPGGVEIVAQLISNPANLYGPTISIAGVTVVAQSISQPSTFYNPTVVPGAVSVLMDLLSQTPQVNNPRVNAGGLFLEPDVLSQLLQAQEPRVLSDQTVVVTTLADTPNVLSPQVVAGALAVVSQLISNPATVIDPKVLQQVLAGSLSSPTQVFDPKVWMTVLADIIQQGITVYLPDVSSGAVVSAQLLDNGQLVLNPEIVPGGVTVSVEPLGQLIQALAPTIRQSQAVDVNGLSQAPAVELPAVLAGSVTVQAESLADAPMVYGPDVYFDQFVVVGFINNPATLNGPRLFIGVIPTNYQWDTRDILLDSTDAGEGTASDLQTTSNERFPTSVDDLQNTR